MQPVVVVLCLAVLGAGCAGVETTGRGGGPVREYLASDRMAGGILVGRTPGEVTRSAVERGVLKERHHIVEQTDGNVARFGAKAIHNTENIFPLEKELHVAVSSFFSSKRRNISGTDTMTVG